MASKVRVRILSIQIFGGRDYRYYNLPLYHYLLSQKPLTWPPLVLCTPSPLRERAGVYVETFDSTFQAFLPIFSCRFALLLPLQVSALTCPQATLTLRTTRSLHSPPSSPTERFPLWKPRRASTFSSRSRSATTVSICVHIFFPLLREKTRKSSISYPCLNLLCRGY